MEGYYSQPVCVGLIVPCVIVACMRGAGAGMRATAAAMRAAVVRASACACSVLLCKSDAGPFACSPTVTGPPRANTGVPVFAASAACDKVTAVEARAIA